MAVGVVLQMTLPVSESVVPDNGKVGHQVLCRTQGDSVLFLCSLFDVYVAGANESSNEITPEFIGRWFIP